MTAIVSLLSPVQDQAFEIIAGRLGHAPPLSAQLGDLLQDRVVNALIDLEQRWRIEVDVDEAFACRTIGRLLILVEAKVNPNPAARAAPRLPGANVADLVAYRARRGLPIRAERFSARELPA